MVQRKVPNKIGIKPHHLKLDTQLVNLRPSSPPSQTHEKMKKIIKKSKPIKRSDESRSSPPFRKKKPQPLHKDEPGSTPQKKQTNIPSKIPLVATPQKQSPNYMKSTSSFEARKEQSPKTPTPKGSRNTKANESACGVKGSRTSSLKMKRTLTKTPSFKPLRSSKKVILCEDVDAQRATCSSTLKESKFPNYLQLDPGGTELDGTSNMKVCPYTYCSLNGHWHAPVPPLKCFLAARRRALKTHKGFKLGCLSPRQVKHGVKKPDMNVEGVDPGLLSSRIELPPVLSFPNEPPESLLLFTNSASKKGDPPANQSPFQDCHVTSTAPPTEPVILAPEEIDMKEENRDLFVDIDWEEGYCSDSGKDSLKLHEIDGGIDEDHIVKMSVESLYDELQEFYDEESVSSGAWSEEDGDSASDSSFEVSSTTVESDINDEMDELRGLNLPTSHQNIKFQQEETYVPDYAEKSKDGRDENRTTIIYNIIQFNISVFVNGEKTENSETDKVVTVQVPAATSVAADKMETEEAMEEQVMSNEDDVVNEMDASEKQDNPEEECNEMNDVTDMDEITFETDIKTTLYSKKSASDEELPDPGLNLTGSKKSSKENEDDSWEFNPRGPNFLPETTDPDAETVDLRHQDIDDRKNAEEWMVDFALQRAVTTLAPARKRKVALLVEAFEKVMPDPIPKYGTHNRHTSNAFTNSRPMQACS